MERQLSAKYLNRIRPIGIPGVSGYAWDRASILDFLNSEESFHYAVLGGDVLHLSGDKMEYTYDSWSVRGERSPTESFEDFAARCRKSALDYILAYPIKDNILFAVVMTSELSAGL
jgi:Immunity protein 40